MAEKNESSSSFPMGKTAQERGLPYVPKCYESQPFDTSKTVTKISDAPIIDLDGITDPTRRSILMQNVANACSRHGFFQVSWLNQHFIIYLIKNIKKIDIYIFFPSMTFGKLYSKLYILCNFHTIVYF